MSELDKALADIADIRSRLAASALFQGFGPAVMAATGLLALLGAVAQTVWPALAQTPETFLGVWIGIAAVASALIGAETAARSRRRHGGLSSAMILNAIEQFLPSGFAGAVLAAVFVQYAPQNFWMLPGLWQMLLSLGIFAGARSLPRGVVLPAAWYFMVGTAVLIIGSGEQALSPWTMGLPFGFGQLLFAGVLYFAEDKHDR